MKDVDSWHCFLGNCSSAMAQAPTVGDRIIKLQNNENLEDAPSAMLKHLGELKRTYLTAVEEKLLMLLESEYGDRIIP